MADRAEHSRESIILWGGGIFLLNLVLKGIFLGAQEIGLDEPFTVWHAQFPPGEIVTRLKQFNNPPLFELILHPFLLLFGNDAWAVRIPSLLSSSLAAMMIALTGMRFFSRTAGIAGSLLFTFSTLNIYFAHEARTYALFTFLSALSGFFFLSLHHNPHSIFASIGLTVSSTLLIYAHYFGFIVLFAGFFWLAVAPHPEKKFLYRIAFFSLLAAAFFFLPQAYVMAVRFGIAGGTHWVPHAKWQSAWNVFAQYANRPFVGVILIVTACAGAIRAFSEKGKLSIHPSTLLLLFMFPAAFLAMALIGMAAPVFLDRYVVFAFPFAFLLIAHGSANLLRGRWQLVIPAGLVLAMAITTDLSPDKKNPWGAIAKTAHTLQKENPGMPILLSPPWLDLGFCYHFDRDAFSDYRRTAARLDSLRILRMYTMESQEDSIVKDAGTALLISTGDPGENRKRLLMHFRNMENLPGHHGVTVDVFRK